MFKSRNQAGRLLAERLREEGITNNQTIVVSLPRGGVVIGGAISALLDLPHQALVAKKIGAPKNPELAIGAMGESKASIYLNQPLIKELGISQKELKKAIVLTKEKIKETKKRILARKPISLRGKTVIIADDGAATGATIISAIKQARGEGAEKVIVALPLAPPETGEKLKQEADEVIILERPETFFALSQFYQDFPQLGWEEVKNILNLAVNDRIN